MSAAAEWQAPRLWEAVGGPDHRTRIYVLGATHWGLPVEYDEYFTQVVLPAFDRSDVLHFEGAGNREPEPLPVCDEKVLDNEGRAIVREARAKALAAALAVAEEMHRRSLAVGIDDGMSADVRVRSQRSFIEILDEFELIENYQLNASVALSFEAAAKSQAAAQPSLLRAAVAHYLAARNPAIAVRDLDSRYGVRKAYCSAGKERIKLLQSVFEQTRSYAPEVRHQIPVLTADFLDVVRNRPLPPTSPLVALAAIDPQIVCQRTAAWLAETVAFNSAQTHFLVVGAGHLHSDPHINARCVGLLDGLAAQGFDVRLVERAASARQQKSAPAGPHRPEKH